MAQSPTKKLYSSDLIKSALTSDSKLSPTDQFLEWIEKRRDAVTVNIEKIPFEKMKNWGFDQQSNLVHSSGKFFSIEGLEVYSNGKHKNHWSQPIINQPEIGYLGIITKKFEGTLHFLMQAKIEPGNINFVQLSPTLQATKSNYTKVHKGNAPHYLEYFNGTKACNKRIILDQLQSEQGARFIKKRNRNIIIEIEDDIPIHEDFCWMTLGQIKALLQHDNVINMDTRTVISGIRYGHFSNDVIKFYESNNTNTQISSYGLGMLLSSTTLDDQYLRFEDIISWITELKSRYELEAKLIPLNQVKDWLVDSDKIYHKENKYFKVIAVDATIQNREIANWTQPLIESVQEGIIAFIIKKINNVYHFLVQAKLEAGNFDIVELAPTVQCLTGNYRKGHNEYEVPFLDYATDSESMNAVIRFDSFQSEEGGRFFKEQNRNMIIEVGEEFSKDEIPANFNWMTLNQLQTFIQFNNYLNIQTRSLIASIKFN